MTKFAIIHDLGNLTEPQRIQYLRDASVYLGLDPDLNPLDLLWINTNEGPSRLTAYARRGTTDILRDIHGITVSSLDQHDGPGYVSFKATGKNKQGRQEIAVGASFIEGLKQDRLAAAIATAQTRALRRLTLQFVGLAVLDESEVNAFTNTSQSAPLSQLTLAPQPSVQPSNAPGKDITLTPGQTLRQDPDHDMDKCVETNVPCGNLVHDIGKFTVIGDGIKHNTQEEFEAYQAKLRADAIASLNAPAPFSSGDITPAAEPPAKKPRKPRAPNKKNVDLGPSEPVPVSPTLVYPPGDPRGPLPAQIYSLDPPFNVTARPAAGSLPAVATAPFAVVQAVVPPPAPETAPTASVAPGKPKLTMDQGKPFRQRLFHLMTDYLEPNGFVSVEGMGKSDQMRALASIMFPEITNMNELDEKQWEKYLSTLENKVKLEGPTLVVKFIRDSIGI